MLPRLHLFSKLYLTIRDDCLKKISNNNQTKEKTFIKMISCSPISTCTDNDRSYLMVPPHQLFINWL